MCVCLCVYNPDKNFILVKSVSDLPFTIYVSKKGRNIRIFSMERKVR